MIDKDRLQLQIDELQNLLDSQHNAYDFVQRTPCGEKTFDEKWQQITQEVFQASLGAVPVDKNKKKR